MPAALGFRDVRLLVTAVGLSAVGDFLVWVPLALHVEATTGSAFAVAAFFFALFGPSVALAGFAGRLADRVENARLLMLISLAQAVAAAALAFSTGSLAAILALSALLGAGTALTRPPESALIPAAAGEHVGMANGLVESARYGGMTAGPVLGGLLAAAGALELALLLDALSFVAVAACARALHARRDPRTLTRAAGDSGRLRDGARHLTGDRVLSVTLAAAIGSLAFFSMSIAAEVIYVKDDLGAGDSAYGLIMATWFGGMVAGALAVSHRVPVAWHAAGALAAIAIQGAGIAGATAGATLVSAFAGFAVGGAAHGVKNVLLRTLIHERVPAAAMGRAFAAYDGARNAAELTALAAAGIVVSVLGCEVALMLAGGIPLAIGAVALLLVGRRRPAQAAPRPAYAEG